MSTRLKSPTNDQRRPQSLQIQSPVKKTNPAPSKLPASASSKKQKTYSKSPTVHKSPERNPQTSPKANAIPQHQPKQRGELLVMTIDLGEGTKDSLKVFEGEDPFILAQDFVQKHGLNPQLVEPLAQNIYNNMEQVLKESVRTLEMYNPGSQNEYTEEAESPELNYQYRERNGHDRFINPEADQHYLQGRRYEEQVNREVERRQGGEQVKKQAALREDRDFSGPTESELRRNDTSERYGEDAEPYEMVDTDGNSSRTPDRMAPKGIANQMAAQNYQRGGAQEYQQQVRSPVKGQGMSSAVPQNQMQRQIVGGEFQSEDEYVEYLMAREQAQGRGHHKHNKNNEILISNQIQSARPAQIHERLYQQGKAKQQVKKTDNSRLDSSNNQVQEITPSHYYNQTRESYVPSFDHSQNSSINYGALLYHRGQKKGFEKKRYMDTLRNEKQEEMEKECTFSPTLNRTSRQIMNAKGRTDNHVEQLLQTGLEFQDRMEHARKVKQAQELDGCTFQPQIDNISAKIDWEKAQMTSNRESDRCLRLFEGAKVRQEVREAGFKGKLPECTFQPQISTRKIQSPLLSTTFDQRSKFFEERLDRINHMREAKEMAEVYDPETGEPYFHPKIGRAPYKQRNNNGQPIGDYLYSQRDVIAESKKKLVERQEKSVQESMARSGEYSQQIVGSMLRRRLEDVFQKLDSDGDGVISATKADTANIETDVLQVIAPVLVEMEEKNQNLNFRTFFEQCEKLVKRLSVADREPLFRKKTGGAGPAWSFKPEINELSQRLARGKRPGSFHSLYKVYMDERKNKEDKIESQRVAKSEQELKECSFRPKISTSPRTTLSANTSALIFEPIPL